MCRSIAEGGYRCSEYLKHPRTRKNQEVKAPTTTADRNLEGKRFSSVEAVGLVSADTPNLSPSETKKLLKSSRTKAENLKEFQLHEREKAESWNKGGSFAADAYAAPAVTTFRLTGEQMAKAKAEAELWGHQTIGSLSLAKLRGQHPAEHSASMGEKFMLEREAWLEMSTQERKLLMRTRAAAAEGLEVVDGLLSELEIRIIALQGSEKGSEDFLKSGEMMKQRKALAVEKTRLLAERKVLEDKQAEVQAKVRSFFQNSAQALTFLSMSRGKKSGPEFGRFFILGMAGVAQLAATKAAAREAK